MTGNQIVCTQGLCSQHWTVSSDQIKYEEQHNVCFDCSVKVVIYIFYEFL